MIKVMIFGTGKNMQRMINSINYKNVSVLCYIDNSSYKIGKKINNLKIISPIKIDRYKYDFIIIASIDYFNITNQLINLGVESYKIIQFYNCNTFLPNTLFFNDSIVRNIDLNKLFLDIYCSRFFITSF